MIPRTYLSTFASNGQQQMRVYFLSSVTGLTRWADYIPVKLTQGGKENSYDNNGFIDVEVVGRSATAVPFKDYVPVYADSSASDAWQVNATGYIPYGYAGFGDAALVLDFTSPAALDPRITFTRASTATYFNSAGVLTTTGFNLLTYSNDLSTNWTKGTGATWVQNAATAPDGTMTALQGNGVAFTIASGTSSSLFQINAPISGNTTYTFSVYVRAQTGTFTGVRLRLNDGTTATLSSTFTVTTEWTRLSLTVTSVAGATVMSALVGTNGFPADLYIWGAQLEAGSAATVYIPTTSATSGAARFDYDPVTLAPKGLLIEEQRTNLLTRSIPDAAVPTGWTVGVGSGTYTHTLVPATGSFSGFQNFIRHEQTTSGRSYLTTTVTLAVSTTYTLTVRFNPGTLNVTSGNAAVIFIQGLTGATGTLSLNASSVPSNGVASITFTTATAVSAGIRVGLGCANDATGVAEFGAWQLEAGAFATSYIPTVASQVTRAADNATMTGTNFSSWYNATEGTLFAEFAWEGLRSVAGQRILVLDDGTTTTYWGMLATGGNGMQNPVVIAGTTDATNSTPSTTYTASTPYKQAVALALNNSVGAINGIAGTTDTAVGVPSGLTTARFAASSAAVVSNLWFRRIAYYNRRLTNAELQGITS